MSRTPYEIEDLNLEQLTNLAMQEIKETLAEDRRHNRTSALALTGLTKHMGELAAALLVLSSVNAGRGSKRAKKQAVTNIWHDCAMIGALAIRIATEGDPLVTGVPKDEQPINPLLEGLNARLERIPNGHDGEAH